MTNNNVKWENIIGLLFFLWISRAEESIIGLGDHKVKLVQTKGEFSVVSQT